MAHSAGFDASPHEHSYMSRHNRNVPTAFYTKFAQDIVEFAEKYAQGRIISVLEGGYSDWALMSASGAYLCGLAAPNEAGDFIQQDWWERDNLELVRCFTSSMCITQPITKTSTAAKINKANPPRAEASNVEELCRRRAVMASTGPRDR
jgi:hypothetical protein